MTLEFVIIVFAVLTLIGACLLLIMENKERGNTYGRKESDVGAERRPPKRRTGY